MDPSLIEAARHARQVADKSYIESLKGHRPLLVLGVTVVIWAQLSVSWGLALFANPWFSIMSFLINCAMLQSMLLWTHEASHFALFRNKRVNDLWTDLFFAAPIGISVGAYRAKHLTHHAYLGTEQDQDSYPYHFNIK